MVNDDKDDERFENRIMEEKKEKERSVCDSILQKIVSRPHHHYTISQLNSFASCTHTHTYTKKLIAPP